MSRGCSLEYVTVVEGRWISAVIVIWQKRWRLSMLSLLSFQRGVHTKRADESTVGSPAAFTEG
jgi:hypothetical protein